MNPHRPRLNDKELYHLQKIVYHRLKIFQNKEVKEESRTLYHILNKLVNRKKGRPQNIEVTTEKITELLIECNYLEEPFKGILEP